MCIILTGTSARRIEKSGNLRTILVGPCALASSVLGSPAVILSNLPTIFGMVTVSHQLAFEMWQKILRSWKSQTLLRGRLCWHKLETANSSLMEPKLIVRLPAGKIWQNSCLFHAFFTFLSFGSFFAPLQVCRPRRCRPGRGEQRWKHYVLSWEIVESTASSIIFRGNEGGTMKPKTPRTSGWRPCPLTSPIILAKTCKG